MSREVFSTCNPLAIDCVLYQEEARTTLWGAGIYYDGVTCWNVNSSGVITGTVSCTTTTTSTTTTTTTEALTQNLFFDASGGIGGYAVTAINVNGVTPTLTSGTDVPFSADGHGYSTAQTGTNQTLNITIGSFSASGCIQVTDSGANYYQLPVSGNGTISFTGLVINNTTSVNITLADGSCL